MILDTLYKSKEVEIFGSGFRKVYSLCKKPGIRLAYDSTEDGFSFIFERESVGALNGTINGTINGVIKDTLNFVKMITKSFMPSRRIRGYRFIFLQQN